MTKLARRYSLYLCLPAFSALLGLIIGATIANPIELQAERQHNLTVVQTVEVAAKNYSRVDPTNVGRTLTCSMAELDEAYR